VEPLEACDDRGFRRQVNGSRFITAGPGAYDGLPLDTGGQAFEHAVQVSDRAAAECWPRPVRHGSSG
jgi:hypothetical protein